VLVLIVGALAPGVALFVRSRSLMHRTAAASCAAVRRVRVARDPDLESSPSTVLPLGAARRRPHRHRLRRRPCRGLPTRPAWDRLRRLRPGRPPWRRAGASRRVRSIPPGSRRVGALQGLAQGRRRFRRRACLRMNLVGSLRCVCLEREGPAWLRVRPPRAAGGPPRRAPGHRGPSDQRQSCRDRRGSDTDLLPCRSPGPGAHQDRSHRCRTSPRSGARRAEPAGSAEDERPRVLLSAATPARPGGRGISTRDWLSDAVRRPATWTSGSSYCGR
jgi:hypothetical protein